jgi:hypothetical protein
MPRNKIVGKNTRKGSNKATGRNYKKESSYNKKKTSYRSALNKEARKKGVYGKRYAKGVDLSHTKSGKTVLEKRSKNRARNGSNGKSTKK